MPTQGAEHALSFMSALLLGVPEEMYGLIWTLVDKTSHWLPISDGPKAFADASLTRTAVSDVYVAVSVADVAGPSNRRISSENSAGLMGLWADIDIAAPDVHKKFNLPPDEDSAMQLLAESNLTPTMVVHSGHGLQAWWLFNEFWRFDSQSDRLRAAKLAQDWNDTLRHRAAAHSWTVDSVFDLARVMRVPGTYNRKGEQPMPVRLLTLTGKRYGVDDIEEHLVDVEFLRGLGISSTNDYVPGELVLREDASYDPDLFDSACENSTTFRDTWEHRRKDLPDQSMSTYDLSLASQCAQAGGLWTDQKIADLLIHHRRRYPTDSSDPHKGTRMDYIRKTITKARTVGRMSGAAERTEEAIDALMEARQSQDPEEIRDKSRTALDSIGEQLGNLKISRFEKYMSDPPSWALFTVKSVINFPGIQHLTNWGKCKDTIAESRDNHVIPPFKAPAWAAVVQSMLIAATEIEIGIESTEKGQVAVWIGDYLAARPPIDDKAEALETSHPWRDEQGTHVFQGNFRSWIWMGPHGQRVEARTLGRMLIQQGCTKTIDSTEVKTVWLVPDRLLR